MKAYGGVDVDVLMHIFLTSALVGCEWSASLPGLLTLGKDPPLPIWKEVGWTTEPAMTWKKENSWSYRDSSSNPSVQPIAQALPLLSRKKKKDILIEYVHDILRFYTRDEHEREKVSHSEINR
jgi:hypothetical protein